MINMKVKLALLLTLVSGCTPSGTGILGQQGFSDFDEDPVLKNAPFAYDLAADTISYNSCVMQPSVVDTSIHGLKIGVSEGFSDSLALGTVRAGIKLRTQFLKYVGENFSPDYGSNTITPSQVLRVLNTDYSTFNSGAFPQFAVRRKSDYAIIPDLITTASDSIASPPRDAAVFPYNLASGYVGHSLTKGIVYNTSGIAISEGSRIYNLSDTSDAIPIEGSFNFNASADGSITPDNPFPTEPFGVAEIYSQRVRDDFNTNKQLLTVTYGGTGSTTGIPVDDVTNNTINNIKRPYKTGTTDFDATKAFGRGYYLKFESQTAITSWPRSRLTAVNEIDLETGAPIASGTSWSCESFAIAHPSHWNNNKASNPAWIYDTVQVEPNCSPLLGDDTTCVGGDTSQQCAIKQLRAEQIKKIRRHYAVADWNIGLMFPASLKAGYTLPDRRNLLLCVAPRTATSCYLPTSGILVSEPGKDVGVQYDRGQECYLTMSTVTGNRDDARRRGRCASFASICTRTSSSF